ncbi:YceI family protein [Ktedonosporobacter rubrisoli]|uniref:YceI family protein n=1 Tax=Ktedonosporobacter rubrisoli TaxID=2509675 RepID=A0A4P6JST7_KTERU|nr:YceI family protein [Ktedonosporobacter rubrisoli]QBD78617.1 YceI family protein [Ktedonosporobacter rubrisoli]
MRRTLSAVLASITLLIVLAACGGNENTANPSTSAAASPTVGNAASPAASSTTSANICPPAGNVKAFNVVSDRSEASYKVQEQFLSRDLPNDAIGKTKKIQGSFLLDTGQQPRLVNMKITVDLSTLTSDQERRDRAIQNKWLESDKYPNAIFVAKDVKLPAFSQGQTITFDLPGQMTVHDVTRPETFKVSAKMDGDTISGTATSSLLMKNYGFDAPDIAGLLTVKDGVTVTFNLVAQKGDCAQSLS